MHSVWVEYQTQATRLGTGIEPNCSNCPCSQCGTRTVVGWHCKASSTTVREVTFVLVSVGSLPVSGRRQSCWLPAIPECQLPLRRGHRRRCGTAGPMRALCWLCSTACASSTLPPSVVSRQAICCCDSFLLKTTVVAVSSLVVPFAAERRRSEVK